ncbi:MAG: 23S rRNA (uracil(1939)-C(5))-methyltransferase RlmD [Firmicutes bacterium]|nr:23S rRNA (uracil(1939)-C(5))-methyltransferase RlmD [Bacillota bacterium]
MEREGEIQITGLNHRGEGVGRLAGLTVFVPGTAPGELVSVRLTDIRRSYARGMLLKNHTPAADRVSPDCVWAENCGGCALQHIAYPAQLRLKTELVRQTIARTGGLLDVPVREIIGMAEPWHYRNNVQFKVRQVQGRVVLGFYARESHRLVQDGSMGYNVCLLAHRELNRVAGAVQALLDKFDKQHSLPLPDAVSLRRGSSGEIMVILGREKGRAGSNQSGSPYRALAGEIMAVPGVASVVEQVSEQANVLARQPGGRYVTLGGQDFITDMLNGLRFRISAPSFYQVNQAQTAVLYSKILACCDLRGGEKVADAYCGVGAIALYLARCAGEVRGYELAPRAVNDARANAALNGIKNARFYAGAVEKVLPEQVAAGYRLDVLVLDPPRAGCKPEVLRAAAESGARRVIYVSCDPATLARDIARLAAMGYQPVEVQPVDMFPHTPHVECVCLLTRP